MTQVRLEPGRAYVLTSEEPIELRVAEAIRDGWRRAWEAHPDGPLIILGPGWSIAPLVAAPAAQHAPAGWDALENVR